MFEKFFKFRDEKGEEVSIFDVILGGHSTNDYIYTMAEAKAINLIAKTIAKTEIQVYAKKNNKKIEKVKDDLYWRLNIQPNHNENGTAFAYKLATKLLVDKRALVIINKTNKGSKLLYVADTFKVSKDILYSKRFYDITLSDDEGNKMDVRNIYNTENAIYFSIKNKSLKTATESYKINSSKILSTIQKKYIKSNVMKWKLKKPGGQPTLQDAETGKTISHEDYKKKITEGLISEEDAIIMLSEAFDLMNLNKENSQSLADYKDMIKIIGDSVANRYDIPLDIFYGTKTEKSTGTNDFITFAVDPYYEILEDGFNIGFIGKESYLKGEMVKYNRHCIQHKDILESASGIDKLRGDGFSRNEVNDFIGLPRIDEKWADKHYITKNYGTVEGGEEDG